MPTVRDLISYLEGFLEDDKVIAYDILVKEDVISRSEELDLKIGDEQAESVLESMHQKRDAIVGLNWDVMDVHIDLEVDDERREIG